MYKNRLSDRSYKNNRKVKRVKKALKCDLRKCEEKALDKMPEDLEDTARQPNSKIFNWHVSKLRENS